MNSGWLNHVRRLQAIAQTGLTYATDPFDIERYTEVRDIAAELMTAIDGAPDASTMLRLSQIDGGYATPKIDVRAAVFDGDHVLLVRERADGLWSLPGGWADVGDSPSVAVIREVKEESGYDAVIRKLAAVYDRDRHPHPPIPFHSYKIFFVCVLAGGQPEHSNETDGVGFFPESDLPPLSLDRVTAEQIQQMFEHYRHPEWPAAFD